MRTLPVGSPTGISGVRAATPARVRAASRMFSRDGRSWLLLATRGHFFASGLLAAALFLLHDPGDVYYRVAGFQVHDLDTLGVAANHPDALDGDPNDDAMAGDHHELVVGLDFLERDAGAGLVGDLEGDDALAAPLLHPILGQLAALAEPVLAHDQEGGVAPDDDHTDDGVGFFQLDPLHAGGHPAHVAHVALMEPDAHALAGREHHVAGRVADLCVYQLVAALDVDGPDPVGPHVPVLREG